jgi:hypothetical protein
VVARIGVVRAGALGDFLLGVPALHALRRRFPGAAVTLVGPLPAARFAAALGLADALIAVDEPALGPLFDDDAPLDRVSPSLHGLDVAIVWLGRYQTVAANLRRLGTETIVAAPPYGTTSHASHVADWLLHSLAPLGVEAALSWDERPWLAAPAEALIWAAEWRQTHLSQGVGPTGPAPRLRDREAWSEVQGSASGGISRGPGVDTSRYAILHAGSGSARKNWPAERWAEVIAMLPVERDPRLVLTLGPAEEAAGPALLDAPGRGMPERQVVLARDLDLFQLAALLQGASLFLGNDSGVTHLAAGLGRPTVAVFGPTNPNVWRPRGPSVRTLGGNERAGVDGAPLIADEGHWPSVEEVAQAARSLLDAGGAGSSAHLTPA